ncbi:MAG: hypothetical protein KJ645_07170, partial [Planctomycetes bacterium]|nr:hypothetical protein [Planctomycetota bacterium]
MLKVIKTQKDYEEALHETELLIRKDPEPESPEGLRLELLAFLIEAYEDERFPIEKPSPVEA